MGGLLLCSASAADEPALSEADATASELPDGDVRQSLPEEVARARARAAWIGWDEAELAKELAPWPDASR